MAIKKVRIKNGTPIDVNDARINGIDSTPTLNSTNVVMSGGVKSALDGITEKIPSQASSTNQLADKAFVNSSIETATADFKGTFNSLAELEEVTANKNDYGFVISTDASGNTVYNRYKYNGTEWLFEYSLNNSSFTAAQWAAIQSGITSALVAKLNGIADGAEVNVQSDWDAASGDAFIKNKPQDLVQDAGYVHTDNNYTTIEKNKLGNIESGAQANVLDGVKVNGVAQTVTDKKVDISVPTALSQLSADATHRVVTDSEKTAWNGKYTKPSGGIPKSDLASDVQTSLGKADTAIQSHQDISGKANKSEMAVSASGDKTTITLKTGTSATVLNAHQDISGKVDKVSGKGLSTNDYTTDEKNKLSGIAAGAQVNVIETVKVNGTALTPSSKAVDVSVPTKVSQLTNDSGYTNNVGTITGITMNGASKGTSGVVDLGTVITSHQDISGKEDKSNKVTSISSSSTDTQYPSAKAVYTGLAAKQNKAYVNNNTLYL